MTIDATSFVLGAGLAFTISIVDRWVQQARARKELEKILAMPRPRATRPGPLLGGVLLDPQPPHAREPIRIEDVPGLRPIEPNDERETPVSPE